ncbi:hypothetical protein KVT40_003348 [Elsinoe batatas]|uniref:Small secreted protein n=1 Tax=Elsinoe batatas TaxID=2601811 RepID=A0A8K0LC33_9PEZI|nr:hypothetical protein KVT40_003348 [Elsinoe batatas]
MQLSLAINVLLPALFLHSAQAKAVSNTKGVCYLPGPECKVYKPPDYIQDSECAFNKRTGKLPQTFAVWKHNPKFDKSHGAPYGTCLAYTCSLSSAIKKVNDPGCWTFFWTSPTAGRQRGPGTDCVRSPINGRCGCQTSDGKFHEGRDDCYKDPNVGR